MHNNTIVFLEKQSPKRTDASFSNRVDKFYHKSNDRNIIELNTFPMVSGFILYIMHCVYLGVMKRILKLLLDVNTKNKKESSDHLYKIFI